MTIIERITHYDEFTEGGGGGTPQVNGNVGGRHEAVIEGYFYRAALGKFLKFYPDGRIENTNELDGDSWIQLGFKKDAIISIEGTPGYDDSYTLTQYPTDRVLYTDGNFVDNGSFEEIDVFDDTPVKCVDFFYNLIENSDPESYYSKTDAGAVQRFSASGFDEAGSGSDEDGVLNMLVASESFGWVTNTLTDEDTGQTDQVRLSNMNTVSHKQYFKINHIYYIAPFALAEQKNNFINNIPPDYLKDGKSLKYIAKIEGNSECGCGGGDHTGSKISPDGCVAWFDQNNKKTRPEYYFDSIKFINADAEEVSGIDIDKIISVEITIKSRNGTFSIDPSPNRVFPAFTYLPLNTDRYVFTPDTLLRENFINDRGSVLLNAGIVSSEFEGTPYQVFDNMEAEFVDVNTIKVFFDVSFASELKDFFKTLPEENRNYFFTVMTQDPDITTTRQSDRVNVRVPLSVIGWDKDIPDLIAPFDSLHVIQFPETEDESATENVAGYEGDPVSAKFPFTLLQPVGFNPTLLNAGFQIVAVKDGKEDFVLEEKIFDTSLVRKLDGVQTVDVSESRGFLDMIDEYNEITLNRDATYDITGAKGFIAKYPFVLRYEYWAGLVQQAEEHNFQIFEDIENPSESWPSLEANGWSLKVKFKAQAQAYEGHVQDFSQYWDITVLSFGEAPETGPTFTRRMIFEDPETGIEVSGIISGKKTRITVIWTGDFSSVTDDQYVYIFSDYPGGGINNRRFASSEEDSYPDCPFSAEDLEPLDDASQSWASLNARINIFGTSNVVLQTVYDDSIENWTKTKPELLILPRLGFFGGCFVLSEDGTFTLSEVGQRIPLESCEETSSS